MVCKIRPDEQPITITTPLTTLPIRHHRPSTTRRSGSALGRLFATGALRFDMDTGAAETCAFEDTYAKWLEAVLRATIVRNHQVEQDVKHLRTRNLHLRRRVTALKSSAGDQDKSE